MAKKKDEKDPTADFFGEGDLDWLDDDEEGATPASAPPSTPKPASASVPTVRFSSVPTLPPTPAPAPPPFTPSTADSMPKTVEPSLDPGVEAETTPSTPAIPASDVPFDPERTHPFMEAPDVAKILSGDFPLEEPAPEPAPEPEPEPEAVEPAVAPPRGFSPTKAPDIPAAPTVRPPKGMTPRPAPARHAAPTPRQREEREVGWKGVLKVLLAEASSVGPGEGRGLLLERAAWVAANEVEDLARSAELYAQARAAEHDTASLLRTQIDVLGRLGRYAEQQSLFLELSARLEGPPRADALVDAALVAWRRLDQPSQAVQHLRSAARVEPENYTARALLRSLWPQVGTIEPHQQVNLLDELTDLAEGGIAADYALEAATLLQANGGRPTEVQSRLEKALGSDASNSVAFLMLEEALLDEPASLASLYEAEATRVGQSDPGWWNAEAARAHQRAGNLEAAVRGFNVAVGQGYPFALRELQGSYVQSGSWFELEDALVREAEVLSPEEGKAYALYRLGWLREARLEKPAEALQAYREAVAADPSSAPAADGVARLQRAQGGARLRYWQERKARATLPGERRFLALQVAETAELEGDQQLARESYREVLSTNPQDTASEVARSGLERVLKRLQDRRGLAELRRQQAAMATQASQRALYLHEAASILSGPMPAWPPEDESERDSAIADLQSALDVEADNPAVVGSMYLLLEAAGRWSQLAKVLQSAGEASDALLQKAAYLYRAGRLFAAQANDDNAARLCLSQSLLADPAFRPARWLLRTISGATQAAGDASVYREEAKHAEGRSERAWGLFAAAEAAGPGPTAQRDLQRILSENPDHPGALAALEVQSVAEGDEEALTNIYLRSLEGPATVTKSRVGARAAALLLRAGKSARAADVFRRLLRMRVEPDSHGGRPLRVCARLALRMGSVDLALELLEDLTVAEDVVERARLLVQAERPSEALRALRGLLSSVGDGPFPLGAASRAATLAQQLDMPEAELEAYGLIALRATGQPLAAAYGSWTGMQLGSAGKDDQALPYWTVAHQARPASVSALDGRVRGLVAEGDVDGLSELLTGEEPERLAVALGEAGAPGLGAAGLHAAAQGFEDARKLAAMALVERLFEEAGDWQNVYTALVDRRRISNDPRVIVAVDEKQHWLLAEHLAQTDAAWDTYRKLHEDSPSDRDVTEALARIAGARGEVETAIGFLRELVATAASSPDAARYQRRVGEVYERAERKADARQAYLLALDHVPTDTGALDGLKRLAESEQDWPGLIAVLQREASLAEGERKVELRRRIAEVTERHIPDPNVAIDAWRTLVELAPRDKQGLERLLTLAEAQQDWDLFVEVGSSYAKILSGAEQGAMLRRVGIVCEDQLHREDAVRYYQQAVAGNPPDAIAAQRLERHARSRADWSAAVEALSLQASADVSEDARVAALLSAARIEVEARHDREAAADFYRKVLELEPNNETALRFMSNHLFERGRFGEAMPVFRRLEPVVERGQDLEDFDVRMELSSFFYYFAEMLRRQGNHGEALERYEHTLRLIPTHLPSLNQVGPLYIEAEMWPQAEGVYRTLLQLSGGQGDAEETANHYTQLGLVERQLGNPERAHRRFNKALEVFPNHVGALKGMALVLEDREDWGNLLNVYNNIIYHAVEAEDVVDAYMTKGRILDAHMGRQDKAAQHYQRCLDFDRHQPLAYLRLAELALRRDAYREAGSLAEKALQIDEDLVRPLRALLLLVRAAAWQSAGRRTEAVRCLREASVLDRSLGDELAGDPLGDSAVLKRILADRMP